MMKLNNEEWTAIADAIAGAHMLNQAVYALLKQRKADLNRDQRQLLNGVPELVRTAFQLLGKIDRRERGEPDEPTNTPTSDIAKLDIRVLRNELENVSALNLPDLTYEIACVLEELPMYAEYAKKDNHERIVAARASRGRGRQADVMAAARPQRFSPAPSSSTPTPRTAFSTRSSTLLWNCHSPSRTPRRSSSLNHSHPQSMCSPTPSRKPSTAPWESPRSTAASRSSTDVFALRHSARPVLHPPRQAPRPCVEP